MMGKMTDVNVWNAAFALEEIKAWMDCKSSISGNVINPITHRGTTPPLTHKEGVLKTPLGFFMFQ